MPKSSVNASLSSYDDIFSTEESRQEEQREQVQQIPIGELFPFKNHPFKVLDDDSMSDTVESVKQYGVLSPLIARPRPKGGYEIISGHRRQHAAELAGLETLPVIVRQMDDDAAIILMVDSNLQREHDYHFDMGGLGNVFHICQFAEVMERNHADFYPEIQTQDEQAAWELGGKGYLAIQSCEDGWDYTLYHSDYSVMDGGQLDAPELTIQEAREQILESHHMEKGRRLLQGYDAVMDKVAEAEELSADHRPSTLEKLAALASDTSAPKSSARSAPEL